MLYYSCMGSSTTNTDQPYLAHRLTASDIGTLYRCTCDGLFGLQFDSDAHMDRYYRGQLGDNVDLSHGPISCGALFLFLGPVRGGLNGWKHLNKFLFRDVVIYFRPAVVEAILVPL